MLPKQTNKTEVLLALLLLLLIVRLLDWLA